MKLKILLSWLKAARLPSQSYIFFPLLIGQVLAIKSGMIFSPVIFLLVQGFGLANQLFIVFGNDYADKETDKNNQTFTLFSGGSRVLVTEELQPKQLYFATLFCALLCLLFSLALSFLVKNFLFLPLCLFAIFLLYAYSYSPFRLSYRGGGELLQMLGVGFVLPVYGFLGQGGNLRDFPFEILVFFLPLHLGTAILTSLPDEPSDRVSEKKTLTVTIGGMGAKSLIYSLYAFAYFIFIYSNNWSSKISYLPILPLAISTFFCLSKPGDRQLSLFIFFGILFHLSIEIVWIYFLSGNMF